jgi:hypothetical protein
MESPKVPGVAAEVAHNDIPQHVFHILNWFFFALCTVAFAARVYVRLACFRHLLLDDYIMALALVLHNAVTVLIHLHVGRTYELEMVQQGKALPAGPEFFTHLAVALAALGTSMILAIVGVLLIKLNFLLFFWRLGSHMRWFRVLWWVVLVFTVATAAAQIGLEPFKCLFGGTKNLLNGYCAIEAVFKWTNIHSIFSAAVDAFSDLMIICFPVAILWRSRIDMRKKVALTFVFSLVFLTVAITILRGSIFHDSYGSTGGKSREQSSTFSWFLYYCEFSVGSLPHRMPHLLPDSLRPPADPVQRSQGRGEPTPKSPL